MPTEIDLAEAGSAAPRPLARRRHLVDSSFAVRARMELGRSGRPLMMLMMMASPDGGGATREGGVGGERSELPDNGRQNSAALTWFQTELARARQA